MQPNLQALNAIADDLDVPILLLHQLKATYGSDAVIAQFVHSAVK